MRMLRLSADQLLSHFSSEPNALASGFGESRGLYRNARGYAPSAHKATVICRATLKTPDFPRFTETRASASLPAEESPPNA